MLKRGLLETGFLLALNPNDKNHEWALEILTKARNNELGICISPAAPVEVSLILRSRGLSDDRVSEALRAMEEAISLYAKPQYCSLTLQHLSYAAELRVKYRDLTFFDSIHAAVAIMERLLYMDLDSIVRDIVRLETGR
ncbi:MAG: PIN domain-containing protein [Desulfurococcales archaeon]|nr:PIN domain-containing protein [Desulfurococcales archaeon]